nr:hypothetical protein Iba_chr15cCG4870 [Ipomoea batatas]
MYSQLCFVRLICIKSWSYAFWLVLLLYLASSSLGSGAVPLHSIILLKWSSDVADATDLDGPDLVPLRTSILPSLPKSVVSQLSRRTSPAEQTPSWAMTPSIFTVLLRRVPPPTGSTSTMA